MNIVIIPSYEPSQNLCQLVDELISFDLKNIVVVDDGSGEKYQPIFEEVLSKGCVVLHNSHNMGKGATLKNGIHYVIENYKNITGFVTCDSDGQHRPKDIKNVNDTLEKNLNSIVLGTRDFTSPNVPKHNRYGNSFSSKYFRLLTGVKCPDTQTGLRGIPLFLGDIALSTPGDRFDYEMTFLTKVANKKVPFVFVKIETVYESKNDRSHFRPFVDSIRIYKTPLRFALSSIVCAGVDLGLFYLLSTFIDENIYILVVMATILARIVSGILNFSLNKLWSFSSKDKTSKEIIKYLILYFAQMGLSMGGVALLTFAPIPLIVSKIIVDGVLFIISYFIQHRWVFNDKRKKVDNNLESITKEKTNENKGDIQL